MEGKTRLFSGEVEGLAVHLPDWVSLQEHQPITNSELNQAVARATGETIHEVRYRGFSPLTPMGGGGFDDIDDEFIGRFLESDDVDAQGNVAFVEQRGSHALM